MSVKHTPGPWYAWHNEAGIGVGKTHGNESDIAHCDGFDSDRSAAEELANARLIAASPELLASLEEMLRWGRAQKTAGNSGKYPIERAQRAIEKAIGECK